jgi:hypothetical protein
MKYFVARMSFYQSPQKAIDKIETKENPIDLLERLLREKPEYTPNKKKVYEEKKGIALLFGNFIFYEGQLVAVKVGRGKETPWPDYDREERKFVKFSRTKFPNALMLWDRYEQAIIIEKNPQIFPIIQAFFNSLENHFNSLLRPYEITVSIIPLTTEIDFWNTIKQFDKIYNVNFGLKMPNLFGHTNEALKETLEQFKNENNAEELSTKISNSNGSLKLAKDSWITPMLKWITIGGGYWSIRCGKKSGRSETITNTDNAKTIESTKELVEDNAEDANLIIESLKKEYQIMDNPEKK